MYYNKRLSETVFFETKLLTLVQSPTLSAIARIVKLQGNCGYLCQPAFDVPAPPRNSPQHHDRPQASRQGRRAHPACGYDISTAGKGKGKGKAHNGAAGYHDRGVYAGRFDCHAGTFV
eukprot:g3225.t1